MRVAESANALSGRMTRDPYDAVVIGGGFFGCSLALYLKSLKAKVLILEQGHDLLQRASFANQARVHNGYHYPRSFLTALRSRINFARFVDEFRDCIDQGFDHYYGIAKNISNVTAAQFKSFCQRIGASLASPPADVRRLFNMELVEEVFLVTEYAFDAVKLKKRIEQDLKKKEVEVTLDAKVVRLRPAANGMIEVLCAAAEGLQDVTAKRVFNCTYSRTNHILKASGVPAIALKHELAEIALVQVPESVRNLGITMMCGPFFSTLPFPSTSLHTLTHVRYTPHCSWQDTDDTCLDNDHYLTTRRPSNYARMVKDAQRYVPALKDCLYVDSLWEIKTVLPSSEVDDSRPILFRKDHGLANLTCVMGAKIDNIYDVISELDELQSRGELS